MHAEPKRPAVVLLSGGLDSATVLAIAQAAGFECHAMSFHYGQRHVIELARARDLAQHMRAARHIVVDIDLSRFGGSALTADIAVPKHRTSEDMGRGIPVTYVPARNTVFLSFALAWAETLCCHDIFIGVNALDYSGYPDCRPEYIEAYERMANLATKASVQDGAHITIHTPLIRMSKAQIIRRGIELGVDFARTSSCYDPGPAGQPCGSCDSCVLRARGFAQAGLADPLRCAR